MKEKGFCSICWKVDNVTSCILCGRNVCLDCMDKASGVCKQCKGGRRLDAEDLNQKFKPDKSVEEFNSML